MGFNGLQQKFCKSSSCIILVSSVDLSGGFEIIYSTSFSVSSQYLGLFDY